MSTMLAIDGKVINSQEPLPIPVDFMTKLWENPNPTSDFAQQQITLSEDATNYEFLMIELKYKNNADYRYNVIGHTGNNIILSYGECGSKGAQVTQRNLYLVSGYPNKVLINNCELATGATASTTSNDHCIPLAIYGFNTQIPMSYAGVPQLDIDNAQDLSSSMADSGSTFTVPKDGKIAINLDFPSTAAAGGDNYYTVSNSTLGVSIIYFRNPTTYGGATAFVDVYKGNVITVYTSGLAAAGFRLLVFKYIPYK